MPRESEKSADAPAGAATRRGPLARRADILCLAALALLTLFFFWRSLFAGAVFLPADVVLKLQPWRSYSRALFPDFVRIYNPLLDAIVLFYPWRVAASAAMAAGQIPLWNPDSFCGQPFLANVSSALLYPPNVLFYLLAPARAYGLAAALHTFLAGAFTFYLLRVLRCRPAAALLGAVTFMFCGFLVVWAEYQTPVDATIWLPLALALWERHAQGRGARYALYAALPLGLSLLGGHLQYASFVMLAFGAFAAWRAGLRPRHWLAAAGVMALAVALAGHQLLPSLELGQNSHRSGGFSLAEVLAGAMPLRQLITFLVPNFYGNIVDYNYWGDFNFVERCGYLGILPLALAGLALVLRRDRQTWFFAGLALASLLIILGTPLYAPLYTLVPGFKQLSSPARFLGVFSLAAACLAAFGADAWAALPAERRGKGLAALGALVGAGVIAVAASYVTRAGAIAAAAQSLGAAQQIAGRLLPEYVEHAILIFFATAAVAAVALALSAGRPAAAWALPCLAATDLLLFGMRFNPAGDPRMLFFPTRSVEYLKQQPGHFRVLALPGKKDFLDVMAANTNLVVGLNEVQGSDAVYPRRYHDFAAFVESLKQGHPVTVSNAVTFSSIDTPGLDFLGARYVLSPVPLRNDRLEPVLSPGPLPGGDPRPVDQYVYRNRNARPRAFLIHAARVQPAERILPAMAEGHFDLERTAYLEEAPSPAPSPAAGPEEARITEDGRHCVCVAVRASSSALLVLADQVYPGWHAEVDGRPAPLLTADYILRAVPVPAGEHAVTFTYRPGTFLVGLYLTLLAAGVLAGTAAGTAMARRGSPS